MIMKLELIMEKFPLQRKTKFEFIKGRRIKMEKFTKLLPKLYWKNTEIVVRIRGK